MILLSYLKYKQKLYFICFSLETTTFKYIERKVCIKDSISKWCLFCASEIGHLIYFWGKFQYLTYLFCWVTCLAIKIDVSHLDNT